MTTPMVMGRFVGAPAHVAAFDGVSIAESTYAAGLRQSPHAHDAPLVSLVLQGDATEEFGGRTRALTAQSLLYTPAYATHGHLFRTPGRWLNMQFSDAWFARLGAGGATLPETPQLVRNHSALAWAARVRMELRAHDAVSRLAIEGALLLMMADLSRLPAPGERTRPRWLRIVEDAIAAAPAAAARSGEELAALAGVHASHLLRTFRRYHGSTVANYVRHRRIERARAAVAAAERPLSQIALDAGFADQSHFTRAFRQAFGETPGQYARSLRGR